MLKKIPRQKQTHAYLKIIDNLLDDIKNDVGKKVREIDISGAFAEVDAGYAGAVELGRHLQSAARRRRSIAQSRLHQVQKLLLQHFSSNRQTRVKITILPFFTHI